MNFKCLISSILFFFCIVVLNAQIDPDTFTPGLIQEDDVYNKNMEVIPSVGSKADDLPLRHSLKKYCPPVANQGSIGSCVGWATGYNAMTMMYAQRDEWSEDEIANNAFSAMFIYNQILNFDDCYYGSSLYNAGRLLLESGNCSSSDFDNPNYDCQREPSKEIKEKASKYKIKDFYALFYTEDNPKEKVYKTKRSLADGNPVAIGLSLKKNFAKLSDKYWDPSVGDTSPWGGHAMVVVGFDDARNSFEIMNTWGKTWGNDGSVWVKYDDFGELCMYAYIYIIDSNETEEDVEDMVEEIEEDKPENSEYEEEVEEDVVVEEEEKKEEIVEDKEEMVEDIVEVIEDNEKDIVEDEMQDQVFLYGKFAFGVPSFTTDDNGDPLEDENGNLDVYFQESKPMYKEGYTYELEKKDWQMNDQFQLMITEMQKSSYVYVFSIDSEGLNVHWPRNEKFDKKHLGAGESPIIFKENLEILIPGAERAFTKRGQGDDNIFIIYSDVKIEDFSDRISKVYDSSSKNINERYLDGFGDISVSTKDIKYAANSMSFVSTNFNKKTVVPIILLVEDKNK